MEQIPMSLATIASCNPGEEPFMTFDGQINGVALARFELGKRMIKGFPQLLGVTAYVWTVSVYTRYLKNLWLEGDFTDVFSYIFSIPDITSNATFPLHVKLVDRHGEIYLHHEQTLAVQLIIPGGVKNVGWRRVPEIRDFVLELYENSN